MSVEDRLCAFRFTLGMHAIPWGALRSVQVEEQQQKKTKLDEMKMLLSLLSTVNINMKAITEVQSNDIVHLLKVFQLTLQFSLWSQHVMREQWEEEVMQQPSKHREEEEEINNNKKKKSRETDETKGKEKNKKWVEKEGRGSKRKQEKNNNGNDADEDASHFTEEEDGKMKKYCLYYNAIKEKERRNFQAGGWHSHPQPCTRRNLQDSPLLGASTTLTSLSESTSRSSSSTMYWIARERDIAKERVKELENSLQQADHVIHLLRENVKQEKRRYGKLFSRATKRLKNVVKIARSQREALIHVRAKLHRRDQEEEEEQRRRRMEQKRREQREKERLEEEEEEERRRRRRKRILEEEERAAVSKLCGHCGGGGGSLPAGANPTPMMTPSVPVSIYFQKNEDGKGKGRKKCICSIYPCSTTVEDEEEKRESCCYHDPKCVLYNSSETSVPHVSRCTPHHCRPPPFYCHHHRHGHRYSSNENDSTVSRPKNGKELEVQRSTSSLPASLPPPLPPLSSSSSSRPLQTSPPPLPSSAFSSSTLTPRSPSCPFELPSAPTAESSVTTTSGASTSLPPSSPITTSPNTGDYALSPNMTAVLHEMQKILLFPRPFSLPPTTTSNSTSADPEESKEGELSRREGDLLGAHGGAPPHLFSPPQRLAFSSSAPLRGVEREKNASPIREISGGGGGGAHPVEKQEKPGMVPPLPISFHTALSTDVLANTGLHRTSLFPQPFTSSLPACALPHPPSPLATPDGTSVVEVAPVLPSTTSPPSLSTPSPPPLSLRTLPTPVSMVPDERKEPRGMGGNPSVVKGEMPSLPSPTRDRGAPLEGKEKEVEEQEKAEPQQQEDCLRSFPLVRQEWRGVDSPGPAGDVVSSVPLLLSSSSASSGSSSFAEAISSSPCVSSPPVELGSSYVSLTDAVAKGGASLGFKKKSKPLPTFSASSALLSPKKDKKVSGASEGATNSTTPTTTTTTASSVSISSPITASTGSKSSGTTTSSSSSTSHNNIYHPLHVSSGGHREKEMNKAEGVNDGWGSGESRASSNSSSPSAASEAAVQKSQNHLAPSSSLASREFPTFSISPALVPERVPLNVPIPSTSTSTTTSDHRHPSSSCSSPTPMLGMTGSTMPITSASESTSPFISLPSRADQARSEDGVLRTGSGAGARLESSSRTTTTTSIALIPSPNVSTLAVAPFPSSSSSIPSSTSPQPTTQSKMVVGEGARGSSTTTRSSAFTGPRAVISLALGNSSSSCTRSPSNFSATSSSSSSSPLPCFLHMTSPSPEKLHSMGPVERQQQHHDADADDEPNDADLIPPLPRPSSSMLEDMPAVSPTYYSLRLSSSQLDPHDSEEDGEGEQKDHGKHSTQKDGMMNAGGGYLGSDRASPGQPSYPSLSLSPATLGGAPHREGTPLFLRSSSSSSVSSSVQSFSSVVGSARKGSKEIPRFGSTSLLPLRQPPRTASSAKLRKQSPGGSESGNTSSSSNGGGSGGTTTPVMVNCRHCGEAVPGGSRHVHESNCDKRPVRCPKCRHSVPSSDMPEHLCDLSLLFGSKSRNSGVEDDNDDEKKKGKKNTSSSSDGDSADNNMSNHKNPRQGNDSATETSTFFNVIRTIMTPSAEKNERRGVGAAESARETSARERINGSDGIRGSSLLLRETQRELQALLDEEAAEEAKKATKKH